MTVKPEFLSFGKVTTGGEGATEKRLTKKVMIKKNKGEDLTIKKV